MENTEVGKTEAAADKCSFEWLFWKIWEYMWDNSEILCAMNFHKTGQIHF